MPQARYAAKPRCTYSIARQALVRAENAGEPVGDESSDFRICIVAGINPVAERLYLLLGENRKQFCDASDELHFLRSDRGPRIGLLLHVECARELLAVNDIR